MKRGRRGRLLQVDGQRGGKEEEEEEGGATDREEGPKQARDCTDTKWGEEGT